MKVVATDADEPEHPNSDIRYRILSQDPPAPPNAFTINPVTGEIMLSSDSADREVRLCILPRAGGLTLINSAVLILCSFILGNFHLHTES